jgi:hypothetical protein
VVARDCEIVQMPLQHPFHPRTGFRDGVVHGTAVVAYENCDIDLEQGPEAFSDFPVSVKRGGANILKRMGILALEQSSAFQFVVTLRFLQAPRRWWGEDPFRWIP